MKNILLLLFFAIAMINCKAQDSDIVSKKDTTATLQVMVGKTTIFEGDNLRFDNVIDDSRCPEGTQCIWAGAAKVEVYLLQNGEENALDLVFGTDGINENNTQLLWVEGATEIHAVGLEPHPKDGVKITPEDYHIILKRKDK